MKHLGFANFATSSKYTPPVKPKYDVWRAMISRCTNYKNKYYKDYGGRGITVCDRWNDYEVFWMDMGPTYEEGLTLDRIDNDGNYEPDNCRWATWTQQNNNQRKNYND